MGAEILEWLFGEGAVPVTLVGMVGARRALGPRDIGREARGRGPREQEGATLATVLAKPAMGREKLIRRSVPPLEPANSGRPAGNHVDHCSEGLAPKQARLFRDVVALKTRGVSPSAAD